MTVTVTVSSTIIPIPSRSIPVDPRDTEIQISDGFGVPLIGGPVQVILDAIHEVRRKIDRMSGNITQVEADIAAIQAANGKMSEDLTTIRKLVSGMTVGTVLSQADVDALHAAAGAATANTTAADEIAATEPVTPIQAEASPTP